MEIRVLTQNVRYVSCSKLLINCRSLLCCLARSRFTFSTSSASKEVLVDSNEENLNQEDEEYIDRLRDKSRLPDNVKRRHLQEEMFQPKFEFHYARQKLRKCYAMLGKKSGLNPGLCFPNLEEVEFSAERMKLEEKPLDVMLENLRKRKAEEVRIKKEREEEVERNMANLNKWRQEMLDRHKKREEAAKEEIEKREQIIAEVREELGFNVHVKDPRFQELLEQREQERKKLAKETKKIRKKELLLKKMKETQNSKEDENTDDKDD